MVEFFDSITEAGDRVRQMLETELQGWFTTVDSEGFPQPTTVWFIRDGDSIVIYSVPGKPKLGNIEARDQASFHLNSDPMGKRWLVMVGKAEVDQSIPSFSKVERYLAKYRQALEHWGMDIETTAKEYSVAIRFVPSRIRLRTR